MKILADTHILIWSLMGNDKLSDSARDIILDSNNTIYYSLFSVWEIAIKSNAHPDAFSFNAEDFDRMCRNSGYQMLEGKVEHVLCLDTLKLADNAPNHHDPFDRILLAQAKSEGMIFLTHDTRIKYYGENCVWEV